MLFEPFPLVSRRALARKCRTRVGATEEYDREATLNVGPPSPRRFGDREAPFHSIFTEKESKLRENAQRICVPEKIRPEDIFQVIQ